MFAIGSSSVRSPFFEAASEFEIPCVELDLGSELTFVFYVERLDVAQSLRDGATRAKVLDVRISFLVGGRAKDHSDACAMIEY